jgi:hypothetical protein
MSKVWGVAVPIETATAMAIARTVPKVKARTGFRIRSLAGVAVSGSDMAASVIELDRGSLCRVPVLPG